MHDTKGENVWQGYDNNKIAAKYSKYFTAHLHTMFKLVHYLGCNASQYVLKCMFCGYVIIVSQRPMLIWKNTLLSNVMHVDLSKRNYQLIGVQIKNIMYFDIV